MKTAQEILEAAQIVLAELAVSHQREMNALAIREARAKAEAAELQAEFQRQVLEVSRVEWRKLGALGGKAS